LIFLGGGAAGIRRLMPVDLSGGGVDEVGAGSAGIDIVM